MLHLRLIVPSELSGTVLDRLRSDPGVSHVMRLSGAAVVPPGDVVACDVAREAANEVVEWLQRQEVHHRGAITVEVLEAVVSDAAEAAEAAAAGHGADALVWEEVEDRCRSESELTVSFLVFMAVAAMIAAVGILLDSPILIVGAMVVGPEYGPLAALCVAIVRRRPALGGAAVRTLGIGLAVAAGASLVATVAFRLTEIAPPAYLITDRDLTSFIAEPDVLAAVVAVAAGVVGMLSLTEGRGGTLIGVLVSVTTIPAVANVGVAAAYGVWPQVGGAVLQLSMNLAGLVVAGVATLTLQARLTTRGPRGATRRSHP